MDIKLMRDFEELEGLGDPTEDEVAVANDEEEIDDSMRPHSVMQLNNSEIYAEVRKPLLDIVCIGLFYFL